jgi:hypothetical protein
MASLDVIFAYVVGVLAALAVIGALAFVVVWEWCAIRRTLAAHRHQTPECVVLARPRGADHPGAAAMRAAGRWLLLGWLLVALVLLGIDGRLPEFIAWAAPGSLLVLGVGSLVRQQLAPSILDRPPLPARYRVADDLRQPIAAVVAVAEQDATTGRLEVPDNDRERWRSL